MINTVSYMNWKSLSRNLHSQRREGEREIGGEGEGEGEGEE